MNYPDIVTSVSVDEGLNYRTVGVNVAGVIATNTVRGDYSGSVKWQDTQLIAPLTAEQKENMTQEQTTPTKKRVQALFRTVCACTPLPRPRSA